MQRIASVKDGCRPVVGIDVEKRANAFHRIRRVRQCRIGAVDLVVLAAHGQGEPIARGHHDRGRPDLDVELHRLARRKAPLFVVRMPRPERQERCASSLRCDARSQPSPAGTRGSFEPIKVTSFPAGSKTRSARNRSASDVCDDIHSLAATGPVISRLSRSGGVLKVRPSPVVS